MSKKGTKVFVPNRGTNDYSAAYEYGDLIFCSEGLINRKDILTMAKTMNDAMSDAEAEDYILITSLSSLCGVACGIFAARFHRLNLLIFDSGEYHERTFTIK